MGEQTFGGGGHSLQAQASSRPGPALGGGWLGPVSLRLSFLSTFSHGHKISVGLVSLTPDPCPERSCGSGALTPDPSVPVQPEMSVSVAERWSRDGDTRSWGLKGPEPKLPLPLAGSGT